MMKGRPAIYATFSSYDEVAHHSGLERSDTMEALRKLDQQFGRIEGARRYAPRPYEIVVLSDHGQTQGATFKQRNGYGLDELVAAVRRPRRRGRGRATATRTRVRSDAPSRGVGPPREEAVEERRQRPGRRRARLREPRPRLPPRRAAPAHAGGDRRAPPDGFCPRFASIRTSAGCSSARSATGRSCSGRAGTRYLEDGRVEGDDPLAEFAPNAARHLAAPTASRTCGRHGRQLLRPALEEGCAFEELICFHGGLGGPQTRPFLLYPATLPFVDEPLVGAAACERAPARLAA
jgi:hypothetical protein